MLGRCMVCWVAAIAALCVMAAPAPSAQARSRCKGFTTSFGDFVFLAVKRRSCKSAKRIAVAWSHRAARSDKPFCTGKGDRCIAAGVRCDVVDDYEDEGVLSSDVRCSPGRRSVRFDVRLFE